MEPLKQRFDRVKEIPEYRAFASIFSSSEFLPSESRRVNARKLYARYSLMHAVKNGFEFRWKRVKSK